MTFNPDDPTTWPMKIRLIAHDVGRSNDRSTAVVGGHCPLFSGARLLGVQQFAELPLGLYGSQLASALAGVDQTYNRDCLIIADLSNDATYVESLFDTFGQRVIGVQICRSGDGTAMDRRRVKHGAIPVYRVGRTFLLELLLAELRDRRIKFAKTAESARAFDQLAALEPEQRESGTVYKCPPGQHDDLAMSLAMLAWAAQHMHLEYWCQPIFDAHRPRRPKIDARAAWEAFT